MLVRLLDAFVWRNHGNDPDQFFRILLLMAHSDRQENSQLGFTYVQGMNVLAAPFLYTMPSEVEAFYCFAKFIEECCPLYVQPTLEGVHRGLKVRQLQFSIWTCFNYLLSYWTVVSRLLTRNCMLICDLRTCPQKFMLSLVSVWCGRSESFSQGLNFW
jgi:hypothetical protein